MFGKFLNCYFFLFPGRDWGWHGRWESSGFEFAFELFRAAGEAGFLVEEVRQDLREDEAGEGEGDDLVVVSKVLDERGEFGLGLEAGEFDGDELGFEDGYAA